MISNPSLSSEATAPARLLALVQPEHSTEADAVADALQADWVRALQQAGWRVGGVRQHVTTWPRGGKRMQLLDVRSPQSFEISQDLGPASEGCRLDPAGVVDASSVLRQALADRVEVVVTNRFGRLEAEGGGFVAEIAALAEAGIPVLTIVAPQYLAAWRALTGEWGQDMPLPPSAQALHAWLGRLQAGPASQPALRAPAQGAGA